MRADDTIGGEVGIHLFVGDTTEDGQRHGTIRTFEELADCGQGPFEWSFERPTGEPSPGIVVGVVNYDTGIVRLTGKFAGRVAANDAHFLGPVPAFPFLIYLHRCGQPAAICEYFECAGVLGELIR